MAPSELEIWDIVETIRNKAAKRPFELKWLYESKIVAVAFLNEDKSWEHVCIGGFISKDTFLDIRDCLLGQNYKVSTTTLFMEQKQ